MITIMQKSHKTVRDPTDKRTFWLKPWVLENWFCGFESLDHLYVSCLSTYIHVLIFLMTTSDLRRFFFFLEVLVKHLSNGFGYTTISCYKSWRWYKSGSIHHCICAIALYLVPPQLATAQFTRSFIKFRLKLNIKIPVIVNPLQID